MLGGHRDKEDEALLPRSLQLGGGEDPEATTTVLPIQGKTARCFSRIAWEPRAGYLDQQGVFPTLMMLRSNADR